MGTLGVCPTEWYRPQLPPVIPRVGRGRVGCKQQEKKDSQRTEHNNDIKPNMDGRKGQSQTRAHKLRRGKNRKHATSNAKQSERERARESEIERKRNKPPFYEGEGMRQRNYGSAVMGVLRWGFFMTPPSQQSACGVDEIARSTHPPPSVAITRTQDGRYREVVGAQLNDPTTTIKQSFPLPPHNHNRQRTMVAQFIGVMEAPSHRRWVRPLWGRTTGPPQTIDANGRAGEPK